MTKFACNICKETYPDSPTLVKHFAANHATTKCHLCNREAASNGNFCPTCRKAFNPQIENIETYAKDILVLETRLKTSQRSKEKEAHRLRELFLTRENQLFCQHKIPREDECQKCEVRPVNKPVVRISLDDFPAATLKRQVIRIKL